VKFAEHSRRTGLTRKGWEKHLADWTLVIFFCRRRSCGGPRASLAAQRPWAQPLTAGPSLGGEYDERGHELWTSVYEDAEVPYRLVRLNLQRRLDRRHKHGRTLIIRVAG
jgi:hypothetical protein